MKFLRPFSAGLASVLFSVMPVSAQVPNTLKQSVPAPPVGAQIAGGLGWSVAVDGGYTVAGAPFESRGGPEAGVVKVFDSATGALLFLLPHPAPTGTDHFGYSVAISGSRVVVGAPKNDTDATDAGSAYVFDLGSATPAVPIATLHKPTPAANDQFGYSVSISGSRVAVSAVLDDTGATDAGSAYVYDLASATPTVPVTTLNNPAPAFSDCFGWSVAISGPRVVVGASNHDTGASNSGSAFVYDLTSGTPTIPVVTLENPSPAVLDTFGTAVAISGTRVVVGADRDDTGATDAGSAYVYDLVNGTPTVPIATLHDPVPAASDAFGRAVAISGSRVVVGMPGYTNGNSGIAYVYDMSAGNPTVPISILDNPAPFNGDEFGVAVAISGSRVVIGAQGDDAGAPNAGSAYGFDLSSPTPAVSVATFNHPGPAVGDFFGRSIAVAGYLMVVGAPNDDTGETDAGSAYVYDLSGPAPALPVAILTNPTPGPGEQFGVSVAISGNRVIVGANRDQVGQTIAGSAYVYDLTGATPTAPAFTLNNPTPDNDDNFGWSVAISGTRVVVGSYEVNGAGSACIYELTSPQPTVPIFTLNNPSPASQDHFGLSVAIDGTRVAVGAADDDTTAENSGRAYVYDLATQTATVPATIVENPVPAANTEFGCSVGLSGNRLVVGAVGVGGYSGRAYVYDLAGATPASPTTTLSNPSPASNDLFGVFVAISGSRVVVAAYQDDTDALDSGIAYLYDLNGASPSVPAATLHNPTPNAGDLFGIAVAIDGTTVAVGAGQDDAVSADKGFAYVFGPAEAMAPRPTLLTPMSGGVVKSPVNVSFTLPVTALPGSVRLAFGSTLLTFSAPQETAGAHTFTFDPANPTASAAIASGSGVADATYPVVSLSYQDTLGNLRSFDFHFTVTVDTTPPATTIDSGPSGTTASDTATFTFGANEVAATFMASLDGAPFAPATSPLVVSSLSSGGHTFSVYAVDAAGNVDATPATQAWTVQLTPNALALAFKSGAVAGAGTDARIQSGALWVSFGPPAIGDSGFIAFLGKWKAPAIAGANPRPAQSGVGLFLRDPLLEKEVLLAKVGEALPGAGTGALPADATFKSFRDPVVDEAGGVAFVASIGGTGVTTANDTVVMSSGAGHGLRVLAREGTPAPGTGVATFRAFASVSVHGGATLFLASLLPGSGIPAVTSARDTGAWWQPANQSGLIKLVREGDPGWMPGETIKSFTVLRALGGSPGQGRGLTKGDEAVLQVSLVGGATPRQSQALAQPGTLSELAATGDALGGSVPFSTATWSTMGLPSVGGFSSAVLGSLNAKPGAVTSATARGIFVSHDSGTTWNPLARTGDPAPDFPPGAIFSAFKDPVNSSTGAGTAFIGTAKDGGTLATDNDAIWWQPAGGALKLIAREGAQPPGAPTGAKWKTFSSLALPGGSTGPLFSATLQKGPGGITALDDNAVYAIDSSGHAHELIREGRPFVGKTVRAFHVLKAVSGSAGVTRSFNAVGQVAVLVIFTDASTAIVRLTIP